MARVYSSADIETDDTAERDAARRPESGAKAARAPTATVVRAMAERIDRKESKAEICDKIPKTSAFVKTSWCNTRALQSFRGHHVPFAFSRHCAHLARFLL
jgi:hypothetical protein